MTAMSDNSLNEIRLDRFQLNVSLIIQTLSTCGHQVWLSDDQCIAQLDIIFPTLYKTVIYLEQFFLNECRYALVSCQPNDDVQTELISILLSCVLLWQLWKIPLVIENNEREKPNLRRRECQEAFLYRYIFKHKKGQKLQRKPSQTKTCVVCCLINL